MPIGSAPAATGGTRCSVLAAVTSDCVIVCCPTTASSRSMISAWTAVPAMTATTKQRLAVFFSIQPPLERLPDREVDRVARLELAADTAAIHLEPDIDADRAERRLVAQAEAGAAT